MNKINVKLYQACIAKKMRLKNIAALNCIENSRFSKILNGKLQATPHEKRILSKFFHLPQKDLFQDLIGNQGK